MKEPPAFVKAYIEPYHEETLVVVIGCELMGMKEHDHEPLGQQYWQLYTAAGTRTAPTLNPHEDHGRWADLNIYIYPAKQVHQPAFSVQC